MSHNRRVKDEINILLFGCQKKTQILQTFVNNNFENQFNDKNNNNNQEEEDEEEEYFIDLEVHGKKIKLILIDVKNIYNSNEYYQRAFNYLYFFDNSNQSSFNEFNQIYKELKK